MDGMVLSDNDEFDILVDGNLFQVKAIPPVKDTIS